MKKNIFAALMMLLIVIINIVSIIMFKEVNIIVIISSITGITAAVMSAKGHINCYYIGLINNVATIIIASYSHFYGTLLLQLLFFIPMQFVGLQYWKKHLKTNTKIVNTKNMNTKKLIVTIILSIVIAFIYSMFLKVLGSNAVFLDALVTTMSIIAMILSIRRYREQWLFWIIVNIVNFVMWSTAALNDNTGFLMAATYVIYLINSVYGYMNWKKLIEIKEN